jgi:protein tyrosine phosphatase (PTP) superfamily phosphohydrolase (DUF442 family)
MKLVSCLPVALFLWIAPQEPAGPPQPQISALNFLRVEKGVCTAGQPSLEDLARLKQEGVRSLINLRRPQEDESGQATEKKTAEELGFKYFFIHCRTAGRVGAFWMIHRVLDDGWSCDKAEQEARQIGLASPHLLAFAKSYILEKKPDACPQP